MRLPRWLMPVVFGMTLPCVAQNSLDRQGNERLLDQSQQSAPNRRVARRVRQAIARDKEFSTYAQKVKVIAAVNGTVTLKGPARTQQEKSAIEAKAAQIAGPGNVNSELFVVANTIATR